jgi:hypothetical protein
VQYQDLTPAEQAKTRRRLRDGLSRDHRMLARIANGFDDTTITDPALRAEIRALWQLCAGALGRDLTLPPYEARMIERDREQYLAPDEELGPLPTPGSTDPEHLVRRIHHQRIALRQLQRLYDAELAARARDLRGHRRWDLAEQRWIEDDPLADPQEDPDDLAGLRAKARRQRRHLRRAHRLIDAQRAELGRAVDALVRRAAAG